VVAYVRIRRPDRFREALAAWGTQTELAAHVGLSLQRVSQLATGVAPVIRASSAAAIEEVLGVRPGALFAADEADLLARYLGGEPGECCADADADPSAEAP
jgi:DNA-binding Xre family transcriptional regulator